MHGQIALAPNPFSRQIRGAGKIDPRIGERRLPGLDDMRAPEFEQRRVAAVFGMGEDRTQFSAELLGEHAQQFVGVTVSGELEHQITPIAGRGLEHVQAAEMDHPEAVEHCGDARDCRIAESLDRCAKCCNVLDRDVGNDGDECVVHFRPPPNETISSSMKGPS